MRNGFALTLKCLVTKVWIYGGSKRQLNAQEGVRSLCCFNHLMNSKTVSYLLNLMTLEIGRVKRERKSR